MSRKSTAKSKYEDKNLIDIFELTIRLSGIDPETAVRSKSADQYWSSIEVVWKIYSERIGINVMYAVLFFIHWGSWPKVVVENAELLTLCEMAKSEFLKHTEEMKIAKGKRVFTSARTAVLKSKSPYVANKRMWKSMEYKKFLESKTDYRLFGGEITAEFNLLQTTAWEYEAMRKSAYIRYRYEQFKRIITRVLPCASSWTDAEWSNQENIINGLYAEHAINYAVEWGDFDCLIQAWNSLTKDDTDIKEALDIIKIKHLPLSMAKQIWKDETEKHIEDLFLYVCHMYKEHGRGIVHFSSSGFENIQKLREEVTSSWLYKLVYNWDTSDDYKLSHKTRKALFEISADIYG